MNLFGKAKKQQNPTQTIQQLRGTLETLEKREDFINKKIEGQVQLAKQKVAAKDKRGAMYALKRKKMLEGEIEKIAGARMTLEVQVMTLENAASNLEIVNTLKSGADTLKQLHGEMRIDQVDNIMDEINEEMDNAQEISNAISQPVGAAALFDDDELLSELNELEEESVASQLGEADVPTSRLHEAPAVPTGIRATNRPETAEERELRELQELESSFA